MKFVSRWMVLGLAVCALAVVGCDTAGGGSSSGDPEADGAIGADTNGLGGADAVTGPLDDAGPVDPDPVDPDPVDPDPVDPDPHAQYPDWCTFKGFDSVQTVAVVDKQAGVEHWIFQAYKSEQPPVDLISIEITPSMGGPSAPGTFDLSGGASANLGQTGLLVAVALGCADQGCSKVFLADEGTLTLTQLEPGGGFAGSMEGVVLREVTISEEGVASPTGNEEAWCLHGYTFSEAFQPPPEIPEGGPAEPQCVAGGTGPYLGDNVSNITLKNCLGEEVRLHDTCGQSKAMWLIATAGWCTACEEMIAGLANQHGGFLSRAKVAEVNPGLDMLVVLGENQNGGFPIPSYCQQYAQFNKLDPAMVIVDYSTAGANIPLVDPAGMAVTVNGLATTWSAINPYLVGVNGQVQSGYPWNAILRGSNMEYVWSDYTGSGDINSILNMLLSE